MEYIEGENLRYAVKRIADAEVGNSTEQELKIISKVGTIMAQVHSHNVVLGDTKPDNVWLKRRNGLPYRF